MKSCTRAFRGARKLGSVMRDAGANARKTGELAMAARQVFAKRMALGAEALTHPLNADHDEFAKIIPEKTKAFSQAGMIWLQWAGEVAEQMASFVAREMVTVTTAAVAMASCRTPANMIATQSSFTAAWFARVLSQSIALGSLAMRSQGATMAPVHQIATANARRLRR
jgi:hypothetical protein